MKTKNQTLRKCKKCGEPKTIGAFRVSGTGARDSTCAACRNKTQAPKRRARERAGETTTGPRPVSDAESAEYLSLALKRAQAELRRDKTDVLSAEAIRREVYGLAAHSLEPPRWTLEREEGGGGTRGCPVTLWSDWHWGEVVRADEVGGLNTFNATIAHARVQTLVSKTIDLAFNHMGAAAASYPGAVVCLGGDMISGDIHEELMVTNDRTPQQAVNDLTDVLAAALVAMRDAFGRVWVPCVVGNHGRTSRKPRMKGRVATSFEYNIYCNLERYFRGDDRVRIFVAPETDVHFRIYGTRLLLTHGDSLGVKGGDGLIGAIGPIMRGSLKLGRSESQVNRDFDVVLMGHWHQSLWLPNAIVNNSLKGYDEYARLALRAPFSLPSQALFFVHPRWGITARWDVLLEEPTATGERPWVSWPGAST